MAEKRPQRFGVLHHPKLPLSLELAQQVQRFLAERGCSAWLGSSWEIGAEQERFPDLDMLITLGGDGTILRAARAGAPLGIPILGINLGRVGFLAELEPEAWQVGLTRLLQSDYWLEERLLLRSEHRRQGEVLDSSLCLNEAVVGRGCVARVVRIGLTVDGAPLPPHVADGLIVATPTGSTAYAFAAGGPILPPTLRNILLVPIAPMFGVMRPIVIHESSVVHLTVETDDEARLTVDGQFDAPVESGDEIEIRASEHRALFARLRPPAYFYDALARQLRCR
jgi:NAD+ kinase